MGGLFSAPTAPVQSNEGYMALAEQQRVQNELLMTQQVESQSAQRAADEAQSEQLREIEIRDAEAEAEKTERETRAKKGKRDLLYASATGVEDDEEDGMLLLGGG